MFCAQNEQLHPFLDLPVPVPPPVPLLCGHVFVCCCHFGHVMLLSWLVFGIAAPSQSMA